MRALKSFFICILFVSVSCSESDKEIAGIYVKHPSVNTADTLFIYSDQSVGNHMPGVQLFKYRQRFYNKTNNKLLFENEGKWWLEDGKLNFKDYYWDADSDHKDFVYSKEIMKDKVILFTTPLELDSITVDEGIYYSKITSM